MPADDHADAVDLALVDWPATAETLQEEVNRQRRQLVALSRWVATQRGRDWTLLPPVFGAGKASAVEAVARLLEGVDLNDEAATDVFASWLTTDVVAHGAASLRACGGTLPADTHSHTAGGCTPLAQPGRRRLSATLRRWLSGARRG